MTVIFPFELLYATLQWANEDPKNNNKNNIVSVLMQTWHWSFNADTTQRVNTQTSRFSAESITAALAQIQL